MHPHRIPPQNPSPLRRRLGRTFLDGKLQALGYDNYQRYLASSHWKDTRERFYADEHTPKACLCGEDENLHLHHLTYKRLGCEELEDLHPLCPTCHVDVHVLARRGLMDIKLKGYTSDLRRARYARQRAVMLKRDGKPEEDWPDEAYDDVVWDFNARKRWRTAQLETTDRHEMARHLAQRVRAA